MSVITNSTIDKLTINRTDISVINYSINNIPLRDDLSIVIPVTIIYLTIFLLGIIGNVATCVVISRNRRMRTPTNIYLFSLALSDVALLVSGLPPEMYVTWRRFPYAFGRSFCIVRGACSEIASNATVLTIVAFTVERYLAICRPFERSASRASSAMGAARAVVVVWCLAFILAVPQATQLDLVGKGIGVTCRIKNSDSDFFRDYSFEISTILLFVVPMFVITVLYVIIGLRLRDGTGAGVVNRNAGKVVKMLVVVVLAFFVCWFPFHAQRLFASYASRHPEKFEARALFRIYSTLTYVSGVFYYLSTAINPLLYNIFSRKFRQAFAETFSCCFRRRNLGKGRRDDVTKQFTKKIKTQETLLSTTDVNKQQQKQQQEQEQLQR